MSHFFCGYKNSILPDISKWNTSKVNNIEEMFARCAFGQQI